MFYNQIVKLCKECNTTATAVIVALGLSKGSIRNWKNGGMPKYEVRLKIANYLGVAIDKLLSEEEIEEQNIQKQLLNTDISNDTLDINTIQYAAYEELENENEEFIEDILSYIKYKKSQQKKD